MSCLGKLGYFGGTSHYVKSDTPELLGLRTEVVQDEEWFERRLTSCRYMRETVLFVRHTEENSVGFIVFSTGQALKLKCHPYCLRAKARSPLALAVTCLLASQNRC